MERRLLEAIIKLAMAAWTLGLWLAGDVGLFRRIAGFGHGPQLLRAGPEAARTGGASPERTVCCRLGIVGSGP